MKANMQNFYKLLNLKPSADIYKIQAALKAAAQSGKFQIETLTEIRDTLYDAEKRRAYNAALRQEDPGFFEEDEKAAAGGDDAEEGSRPAVSRRNRSSGDTKTVVLSGNTSTFLYCLCALGVFAWFLPWVSIMGFVNISGYSLSFFLFAWLSPLLMAACIWRVWRFSQNEGEIARSYLVYPALMSLLSNIQVALRIKSQLRGRFGDQEMVRMAENIFNFGIGWYLQVFAAAALLFYLFFIYKDD